MAHRPGAADRRDCRCVLVETQDQTLEPYSSTVAFWPMDRGRERRSPSPPSEPAVQFSRDGLSSQLFPHRDWRAK